MDEVGISLTPLEEDDREQFILDNQYAFRYGATEEFGRRDDHFEEDGEIISRKTIVDCIDAGIALRIRLDGRIVGGMVLNVDRENRRGSLELLFVDPDAHSRGIGSAAWREVERRFPDVRVWQTCTPYFETRNIHFYINKCGFHAVEFFNRFHPDPHDLDAGEENEDADDESDGMFLFEKYMPEQ